MSSKKKIRKKDPAEKITTMKVLEETKLRLEKLREHKRESYDDILRKMLYVLNLVREEPEKGRKVLERVSELRNRWLEEEARQKQAKEEELGRD